MMANRTLLVTLALVVCAGSNAYAQKWQDVTICAVNDDDSLVEVPARLDRESYDTTTVDGRFFGDVYPTTPTRYAAGNAWFMTGEPIGFGGRRYEKYGLPRVLGVSEIVRIGQWAGISVFGPPESDEVIYLPVRTGCEFQPYSVQSGPLPAEPAPAPELSVSDQVRVWIVPQDRIRIGQSPDSIVTIREIRFSLVATEVMLEFNVARDARYVGTLHPPGAPNAFTLRDALGAFHQPFAQGGWGSPDHAEGWGTMQVPGGRPWHVVLYFPPIYPEARAWLDLREGGCTESCWHFRDIRIDYP